MYYSSGQSGTRKTKHLYVLIYFMKQIIILENIFTHVVLLDRQHPLDLAKLKMIYHLIRKKRENVLQLVKVKHMHYSFSTSMLINTFFTYCYFKIQ